MRLSPGPSLEKAAALKKAAAKAKKPGRAVAIVRYDEKPGIQAIATTAPDLPPEPGGYASFARDHEYKRHEDKRRGRPQPRSS